MKIKINISKKNLSFPGIKISLGVLTVMLLAGIAFSVVQIATAGVTGPHDPGHIWATLDKPGDCSSGYYVYGANDSGWLCSALPVATSYWTRDANNALYPTGNPYSDNIKVAIGDFMEPVSLFGQARLSINAGLGSDTPATIGVFSKGQSAGGYFQSIDIYGNDSGARAFLGYKNGGDLLGIQAEGEYAGGYFKDTENSVVDTWISVGTYSVYGDGIILGSSKQFSINHPTKPGMKLVHASIEGPENAVYYRGEDQLINGRAEVQLPEYFEALVRDEGRTVLLTPKFEEENDNISQLAASAVLSGKFTVRATDDNNPNQKFYWEVKAVRDDVSILVVEQPAENFPELAK